MPDCSIYSFAEINDLPALKLLWDGLVKNGKQPTFVPEALVEINSTNPVFKKPNAEIRSWARGNLKKKYARRPFNSVISVFFFSSAEDAVIFKMFFSQ
jgi:hypothetical protein